ncbi:hypothetical protein HPB51_015470 [Rhipicephalus microplus]|uniref:CCHC-type domain-containing protein n=1 Tax=Rhipicephalus microplus TaxID=6941 RepID=A0A9J6EAF5_RHIMP|nr:hypothetical protein HPB51_015470 [Rhipicephalus microplus]
MEKINVRRAVQVVSPPVTAALKPLKERAGHTCDASFAHVGPTVVFMDTMYWWFNLMDVSNCTQHVHQNNPDCKQYESEDDERLGWLETSFLDYLAEIKRQSPAKNFLTKETYEGLLITTISNVECVRYLLTATRFRFVLTRKMSSDPIEAFFGWLRKSAGSNDQTDVRVVLSGIEKALKTGIACTSSSSNVITADSSSCSSSALILRSARAAQNDGEAFPAEATTTLEESLYRGKTLLPTPDVAALAMVGGYIARTVHETISCDECFTLVTKANTSAPSGALIRHQDRALRELIRSVVRDELQQLQQLNQAQQQPSTNCIATIIRDEVQHALGTPRRETPTQVAAPLQAFATSSEPLGVTYADVLRRTVPSSTTPSPVSGFQRTTYTDTFEHNAPAPVPLPAATPYATLQSAQVVPYFADTRPVMRKSDIWRMPDRRPLCYHCGEAGHLYRDCQYRRLGLQGFPANSPRPRFGQRPPEIEDFIARQNVPLRRQSRSPSPRSSSYSGNGNRRPQGRSPSPRLEN